MIIAGVLGSLSIPKRQVARTFDYEHRCAEHEHEQDIALDVSCAVDSPVVC